ncbi:protein S100-A1-like isoform X1, partial [Lates japonicus]
MEPTLKDLQGQKGKNSPMGVGWSLEEQWVKEFGFGLGVGGGRERQVIFKPLANSLPIHLCLGSVPCTSSKTKEGPPSALSLSTSPAREAPRCRTQCVMSKEPSSNLESAMQMLIKTFHKYSGKEGDKYTLSRGELKELLLEELGSYLGSSKDNEAVEKVMNDLDANNDGEVDFTEFIILMGALTVACNDFFL